jgi:HAD superfamily hydrolase (TIGR01509 family)
MAHVSAVLFDVDGTLVDSNYHHTIAWARALRAHGHTVPLVAIHRLVGMGGPQLLEELIGEPDDAIEDAWRDEFDRLLPEIVAFDGAADLLRRWHERECTIVLATSSPKDLFESLWQKVGADAAVDGVVTASDADRAKPHPDLFAAALTKAGVSHDAAVAVGDSVWDVTAAGRAGVRCIALECGGYSRAELEQAGAVAVYRDPQDLRQHLDEW